MTRLMQTGALGTPSATVGIRQLANDRRQRRRAALDLGGNQGYHRRAGLDTNRRLQRTSAARPAALAVR